MTNTTLSAHFTALLEHLHTAAQTAVTAEHAHITQAGALVHESLAAGGVLHTFGSGHSQLVAKDIVGRSGAFIATNEIIDRTEDMAEQVEGYGTRLLEYYDNQYQLVPGEVIIVVSNSGVNPLPIEIAAGARERGLHSVAITNVAQSAQLPSRHSSGKRLFEVASIAISTHAPAGEATVNLPGASAPVGTVATAVGTAIINAIVVAAQHAALQAGNELPVYVSENDGVVGAAKRNEALRKRYQGRLRRFGV